jgi:hypothetical protein
VHEHFANEVFENVQRGSSVERARERAGPGHR